MGFQIKGGGFNHRFWGFIILSNHSLHEESSFWRPRQKLDSSCRLKLG